MRVEHNGLYKWAISFFNGVGNFNFRSFSDAKELTFEIRPSDISPKENYPSYLSIVRFSFPRKIFTSDSKKSFYFSRKLQITFFSWTVFIIYRDRSNTFVSHCTRTRGSCRPHSTEIPRGPPPRPSFKPFQGCCIRLDGYNAGTATAQWLRNSCERRGGGKEGGFDLDPIFVSTTAVPRARWNRAWIH